ncbi:UNVERIFIED_CONTAM: hypothetical protein FKN15_016458 [Acipenser sinensis]
MPVRQDAQLEKLIDETLKKSEFQSLEEFLQGDINEDACQKCTKQFINKLDKVIRRVVYENSSEGKKQVIGSFLHRTGELIADSSVHITIQQEAVRKLNMILDEIPKEDKTQILSSGKVLYYDLQVAITEALCRMTTGKQRQELADQWFTMEFVANAFKGIKDSEFETLLMPADDKLQDFWIDFNVGSQSITFYISPDDDEEETQWETVCLPEDEVEKYLVEEKDGNNLLKVSMKHPLNVSGKEGSQIQIYFSAALNIAEAIKNVYGAIKAKLLMPADDKLQDFWIDFNVGSQSITFYISPDDDEEETQWETVCLPEDEVEKYLVEEKDGNNLLKVSMKHPLNVSGKEGSQIQIYFSAALNIAEAIKNVYGAIKAKEFVGKCGSSVAKTTVRIIFDEDGSQLDTPAKMRVSEATLAISSCGGSRTAMSPIARVMTTSTPARKGKVKPALELVGSSKRNSDYNLIKLKSETPIRKSPGCIPAEREYGTSANNKQIPAAKVAEMLQEDQDNARASEEEHLGQSFQNRVSKQQAFSAAFNDQSPPQLQRSKEPSQKQVQEQLAEKLEKPNKEKKRKHEADGKRSSGETSALEENQAVVRGIKGQGQAPLAVQKAENSAVQCSKSNKKPALGSSRKETIPQEMSPARNHRDSVSHRQENLQRGREREMEVSYREMKEKKTKSIGKDCIGVTETMISSISSKYRTQTDPSALNRSHLEKSWSFSFLANDTRRLEKSGKSDKSGKSEDSRIKSGSLEKGECKKPGGRYVKKHLFSDTDTEPRPDDSRNEVSWLQDYNRRPKPNVVDYSRQRHGKPPPSPGNDESPEFPPAIPKPRKEKAKAKKKVGGNENAQKDKAVPTRQTGRPQRAAAKGRRYWEPSESGSDVESVALSQEEEQSVYKPKQHPAKTNQERNKKVSAPPEQKKSAGALPQVTMHKELQKTWISQFSPLTSPPPSIEKMRCAEKSKVVARPTAAAAAAALPDLTTKPKNPHETSKQIHPKKFYKSNKSKQKAPSPPPPEAAAKQPKIIVQDIDDVSTLLSPVVMPLLTSTILKKSLVSEKDVDEEMKPCLEIQDSLEQAASLDNECAISVGSHSNSSDKIALYTEREQEEELLGVRRGLQSLFLPEGRKF